MDAVLEIEAIQHITYEHAQSKINTLMAYSQFLIISNQHYHLDYLGFPYLLDIHIYLCFSEGCALLPDICKHRDAIEKMEKTIR